MGARPPGAKPRVRVMAARILALRGRGQQARIVLNGGRHATVPTVPVALGSVRVVSNPSLHVPSPRAWHCLAKQLVQSLFLRCSLLLPCRKAGYFSNHSEQFLGT